MDKLAYGIERRVGMEKVHAGEKVRGEEIS